MTAMSSESNLSPDDRYELASKAMMQERRARPVHFVLIGLAVFLAALIFLVIAWKHSSTANNRLVNNRVAAFNVARMIQQIQELTAAQNQTPADDEYAPIPDLLTRIARIGNQSGLENDLSIPRSAPPRQEGGARLLSHTYTVRDSSLESILQWIQRSRDQIPGLQVRELTLNLNAKSWIIKVTLSRYERIE